MDQDLQIGTNDQQATAGIVQFCGQEVKDQRHMMPKVDLAVDTGLVFHFHEDFRLLTSVWELRLEVWERTHTPASV